MRRGKIVVIEGGDSSGKEVQSRKLYRRLRSLDYPVKFLDFPRYRQFFGKLIARYLRGEFGAHRQVSPWISALPYALDRFEARERIRKWLNAGFIIICNRYVGSNLAYMSAKLPRSKRPSFIKWIEDLEYQRLGLPKEDVAICLNVDAKMGQKLTYAKDEKVYMKGLGRGDIHERDLYYLSEVVHQYLWLAKNRRNRTVVFCMNDRTHLRSKESIHQEIMDILDKRKIIISPERA